MKLLKDLFLFADLFGKSYSFEQYGSNTYKTTLGGFLTIIMVISVSVIGFLFGKEIYLRELPISNTAENLAIPADTRINITNIPFIVTFHNYDGSALQNLERVLELETMLFLFDDKYNISLKQYNGFIECKPDDFGNNKKYVQNTVSKLKALGNTPKCLNADKNLYFQNDYSSENSAFLNFQFKICDRTKEGNNCLPEKELASVTTQIYVALRYLDSYLDPKNYTNPITYYENIINQQVGNQFLKRNFLRFTKNILKSDVGWIFETNESLAYISLKSLKTDMNPTYNGYIYWITLESPKVIYSSTRNYMKVQELIAKIGGLFNGISLIIFTLLYYYVRVNYYADSINKVNKNLVISHNSISKLNISDILEGKERNAVVKQNKKVSSCQVNKKINDKSESNLNKIKIWKSPGMNEIGKTKDDDVNVSILKEVINMILPCLFKENKVKITKVKRFMMDLLPIDKYLKLLICNSKLDQDKDS